MNYRRALAPYSPIQPEVGPPGRTAQPNPAQILQALRSGLWDMAVRLAMGAGITDVNQLTDILFYVLHPELRGKRLDSSQRDLGREWINIRDRRVRPVLESRGRSLVGVPAQPGNVRTFFGVDIARAENQNVDWLRAKAQVPIEFAIIQSNYGPYPDRSYFPRTWPKLKDAGIVRGAYMFLVFRASKGRWLYDPVTQAKAFIAMVKNLDESDLPPALDVEADNWQKTGMNPMPFTSAWSAGVA